MSDSDYPLIKNHSFVIGDYSYKASAIFYSDTLQIFVTFDGKIGNFIQSSYKFGKYDCQTLLGNRSQEFKAICRCLIERYKDFVSIKSPIEQDLYLILCANFHDDRDDITKSIINELAEFFKGDV